VLSPSPRSWITPRPWRGAHAHDPDGVYEAESYMDDDGIEVGKPVPTACAFIVKGDEMPI
jgi:hypothetical protein